MSDITSFKITALEMAKRVNALFDTTNVQDIEWFYVDDQGNVHTYNQPNLAKLTQIIKDNSVDKDYLKNNYYDHKELDNILNNSYYTKATVDSKLNSLTERIDGLATIGSTMSKADYFALVNDRKKIYAGSGQINRLYSVGIIKNLYNGGIGFPTTSPSYPSNTIHLSDNDKDNDAGYKYVINGHIIHVRNVGKMSGADSFIFLPPHPTFNGDVITDINNPILNKDLNEGDFCYVDFTGQECLPDPDFNNGVGDWTANSYCDLEYDSGNERIVITNHPSGNSNGALANRNYKFIPHMRYKYTITVDELDTGCELIIKSRMGRGVLNITQPGTYTATFEADINDLYINVWITGEDGVSAKISKISVEIAEPAYLLCLSPDAKAGTNIFENRYYFEAQKYINRRDLVFIETWIEDISKRDFAYPYGNVQYVGYTPTGLPGIVSPDFSDKDTYPLMYHGQDPSTFSKVKGWKWSILTEDQKRHIASNPEHNIYRDGDTWYQVRYRIRSVRGPALSWRTFTKYSKRFVKGESYKNLTPETIWHHGPLAHADNVDRKYDVNLDFGANRQFRAVVYKDNNVGGSKGLIGAYGVCCNGIPESYALPLFLVNRRNDGIYHPTINPEGTAKIFYNNNAVGWWEIPDNFITDKLDCFNPDKIAVINPETGDAASLTSLLNGDVSSDTYIRTGYKDSKTSGREDGLYCDSIHYTDVTDERYIADKKSDEEILNELTKDVLTGEHRDVEYIGKLTWNTYWLSSSIDENLKDGGKWLFDPDTDKIYNPTGFYKDGRLRLPFVLRGKWLRSGNKTYREILVQWLDSNFNVIDFGFIKVADWQGAITVGTKPENAVAVKILEYETDYNYFGNLLEAKYDQLYVHDILGDPRPLNERNPYTTPNDSSIKINLNKYDHVLCTDNTNNSGTTNHYYLYVGDAITNVEVNGTDGTANASDGHVDLSDTNVWLDLGDDPNVAGLPGSFRDNAIPSNNYFRIYDDYGNDIRPDNVGVNNGNHYDVPLSRKYVSIGTNFKVYILDKNRNWVELTYINDSNYINTSKSYYLALYLNRIRINILDTYSDLGYSSADEMLDLMVVRVSYETFSYWGDIPNDPISVKTMSEKILLSGWEGRNFSGTSRFNDSMIQRVHLQDDFVVNSPALLETPQFRIGYVYPIRHEDINSMSNTTTNLNNSPKVKGFLYLYDNINYNIAQLAFQEIRTQNGQYIDDQKLSITSYTWFKTDANSNNIMYGIRTFSLKYWINRNQFGYEKS